MNIYGVKGYLLEFLMISSDIRLFKQHRATQLDAVKSIQKFSGSYEKQYKLVETIVQQLFKVR